MPTIVVAVDYSRPSRKALDAAVALAKQTGADLVMVHAVAPLPRGSKAGHLDPVTQVRVEVDEAQARKLSTTWAKKAAKQVPVEVVIRRGKAADIVVAEAASRKASTVVVGSHGRTGLKRVVLGSVAERIVQRCKQPVLVVPS